MSNHPINMKIFLFIAWPMRVISEAYYRFFAFLCNMHYVNENWKGGDRWEDDI